MALKNAARRAHEGVVEMRDSVIRNLRRQITKLEEFVKLVAEYDEFHTALWHETMLDARGDDPNRTQLDDDFERTRSQINERLIVVREIVTAALGSAPTLKLEGESSDVFENIFSSKASGKAFLRAAGDQAMRVLGLLQSRLEVLEDPDTLEEMDKWEPASFSDVVAQLEGQAIKIALARSTTLRCPPPDSDPKGHYRVAKTAAGPTIQRHVRGRWEDLPLDALAQAAATPTSVRTTGTRLFISHAHADHDLAMAFTKLLEAVFDFDRTTVRCTSVRSYTLKFGTNSAERLREELADADLVVGLLTNRSLESDFVLMELGAAWGLGSTIIPAIMPSMSFSAIPAPIGPTTIAPQLGNPGDVADLLDLIETRCGMTELKAGGRRHDETESFSAKVRELYPPMPKS